MDYQRHYNKLIVRAKSRLLEGYTEKHRIIPGCMDGVYDENNVVLLTPEEHYVAHQLLVKIYPNNHKLIYAANMMSVSSVTNEQRNNKSYGWLKRKFSVAHSKNMMGHSFNKGIPKSEEHKRKLSEAHKGKVPWNKGKTRKSFGSEWRNNMSIAAKKRAPASEEARQNMSKAKIGKKLSEEHKHSISEGWKKRRQKP